MASTKYTKSIADDTSNGILDSDSLENEIRVSSIETALDYMQSAGDDLDIWFKAALSAGDQTTLTTVVGAHTGECSIVHEPCQSDGRRIFAPATLGSRMHTNFSGRGDNVATGQRFTGQKLRKQMTSLGDTETEWQYIEYQKIVGGRIRYTGAEFDDHVIFEVYAPATAGTSNPGAGAYDKYAIGGGINMFIPNGTTTGDWDLNLTEKLNANVDFTKVVPVPAEDNDGFFDWDIDTNAVTFNATQTGKYNLFDSDMILTQHVTEDGILGDGWDELTVPAAYTAQTLLPHWKYKLTIHKETDTGTLSCVWRLFLGRKSTTPN